jgi:hypothetical protein
MEDPQIWGVLGKWIFEYDVKIITENLFKFEMVIYY